VKIPRDVSGSDLVKGLKAFGYDTVRQEGSHIRLTTSLGGKHSITVPNHSPIKLGTLSSILKAIALHQKISVDEVLVKIRI